jgi:hypothetical protein
MPQNFPEAWLNRVIVNINNSAAIAPWLEGIPELDAPVIEAGSGSAGEINEIHIPTSTFEPDVLINNSTYPIEVQAYDDDNITVRLDKYQTKVTTLTDDQIIGAAYSRIDNATRSHTKAIHAMAPASNTTNTPVLLTTGTANSSGRKIFTYDDLVALKDAMDKSGAPMEGRRFVPSYEHYNDLLLDRKNFGDQLVNYKAGQLAPTIAGFQIYPAYLLNPYYTGTTKKPFASAPSAGDKMASVCFVETNVAKKSGMTKQYFTEAKNNPRTQANEINYRHYFITMPMLNKHIGTMISG